MRSSKINSGDNGLASQYNNLRSDAQGSGQLSAHQQDVPNLTVKIEAGTYFIGGNAYSYAGGNSPTIAAPTTNPRIDLVVIDTSGTVSLVAGTEAASPSVPARPVDKYTICAVYCRVGQTKIYDNENAVGGEGYIYQDLRSFNREQNTFATNDSFSARADTGTVTQVQATHSIPATAKNCKFLRFQVRCTIVDNNHVWNTTGCDGFGYHDLNITEHNNKLNYDVATWSFFMNDGTNWHQCFLSIQVVDGTATITFGGPAVSTGTHYYDVSGQISYYD